MKTFLRWAGIRLPVFVLVALCIAQTPARASVIQSTMTLPPATGAYTLASFLCFAPVCLKDISVSGFQVTSDVFSAGNELVDTYAILTANVFQNIGGNPGAPVGALTLSGTMDFTYFGRSAPGQLGTFNAQITSFDLMGTFNGHVIEGMQNPNMASTGQTTILAIRAGVYEVNSFFDVFAQLSIDRGPFSPGPERHAELTSVPEPGSVGLILFGLLGLAGVARSARQRHG